jgi:hypothetical protein
VRKPTGDGGADLVVSGGAESDDLRADAIVARGDISSHGLERKAAHEVSGLTDGLVTRLPGVAGRGFRRWIACPPVPELELEIDIRRVTAWQVL